MTGPTIVRLVGIGLQFLLIGGWWYGVRRHYSPTRKNVGTPGINLSALVGTLMFQVTTQRGLEGIWPEAALLGAVAEAAMFGFVLAKPPVEGSQGQPGRKGASRVD